MYFRNFDRRIERKIFKPLLVLWAICGKKFFLHWIFLVEDLTISHLPKTSRKRLPSSSTNPQLHPPNRFMTPPGSLSSSYCHGINQLGLRPWDEDDRVEFRGARHGSVHQRRVPPVPPVPPPPPPFHRNTFLRQSLGSLRDERRCIICEDTTTLVGIICRKSLFYFYALVFQQLQPLCLLYF